MPTCGVSVCAQANSLHVHVPSHMHPGPTEVAGAHPKAPATLSNTPAPIPPTCILHPYALHRQQRCVYFK